MREVLAQVSQNSFLAILTSIARKTELIQKGRGSKKCGLRYLVPIPRVNIGCDAMIRVTFQTTQSTPCPNFF